MYPSLIVTNIYCKKVINVCPENFILNFLHQRKQHLKTHKIWKTRSSYVQIKFLFSKSIQVVVGISCASNGSNSSIVLPYIIVSHMV